MRTILIVEDNPGIAKALSMRMKHYGFSVMVVSDAPSALMQARKREPDLALVDISIPGGNGFDVAEALQHTICEKKLPIVFMTASKDPELRQRAGKLNAAGYLEKPFSAEKLLTIIDDALLDTMDPMHTATSAI